MAEFQFPKKFLWGSATSAHQVEGHNTANDWWQWEKDGNVRESSGEACRHYDLFEKDFDLAASLNHNAHRFSIEWSRLQPTPGSWDEKEVEHYRHVLTALRKRGLIPIVTLHHFTNPAWLAEKGGWRDESVFDSFRDFAGRAALAFGDLVDYWITINEPLVFAYHGYMSGAWPPGEKNFRRMQRVIRNLLIAHQHAYKIIHEISRQHFKKIPFVSIAKHTLSFSPCSEKSMKDRIACSIRDYFFNYIPIEALIRGYLLFPGVYSEKLPFKKTLDFIGVNYYTRDYVHFSGWILPKLLGSICTQIHHEAQGERNLLGWEFYPEGLYQVLMRLKKYSLPILITENGTCAGDDHRREAYIESHLGSVARAMQAGLDVWGYLYWSLIDNFEWAHGFAPRFGMIDVDYETQERKIRPSARRFAEICQSGIITL